MSKIIREEADKYQELFNHMSENHNLALTISEMNDIINECSKIQSIKKNSNRKLKPPVAPPPPSGRTMCKKNS